MRRSCSTFLIVIFIGLICAPMLDTLFHLDRAPIPNENRALAKFPPFNGLDHAGDYVAGLEKYFNDHFGFRRQLVRWNNHWKQQLFNEGQGDNVIIGRNGWLFYGKDTIANFTRQSRFTEKDLRGWQTLLEARRDWLAARGVKYMFVIPPDKHSVYPEYLPSWLVEGPGPSKVEQFLEYMGRHSPVPVLSLRLPLVAGKKTAPTYLKTDSHWNAFGAFIGYQELIKSLSRQMPGLQPLPREAFDEQPVVEHGGDLAVMLGQENAMLETQQFRFVPRPPLERLIRGSILRLIKKTPHEFDGTITLNNEGTGKALVFHDSFASGFMPFLGYNFHEVVYIYRHDWDMATLDHEKPDVVIDEMVERTFDTIDPMELLKKDGLK